MDYKNLLIEGTATVLDAMKQLDQVAKKVLYLVENEVLIGALSDGDIRRWILTGGDLHAPITGIFNRNPKFLPVGESESVKDFLQENGIESVPLVDEQGHIIMDFSIFDAKRAGFEKVVFIIKHEDEADFREAVGDRMEKIMEVEYAYQDMNNIPEGFSVPEGRVKPWGTAHAVLSAIDIVDGPFAVINADDYYGKDAFQVIYDYLSTHEDDDKYRYTMVGYELRNTVTENGHVARGICEINEQGELTAITERTKIEQREDGIAFTEDDGATWTKVPGETLVSMNMWGFTRSILDEIKAGFPAFLEEGLKVNPMKCEYFLPSVVSDLVEEDKASVVVLSSKDKWYGVTYKEDKPVVVAAIQKLKDEGLYPEKLWEEA